MKINRSKIAIAFVNPDDRRLIADYLSSMNYEVLILSNEPIPQSDLFLLDVPSAQRFGPEVRKRKETEEVFLPAMVALGRRDSADPWLAAGYDDVLRMPLSRAELRANIGILLRLRQQTLELKKRGEAKYQAIFEATGTATLLVDEDTTILMANQECLRLTGYNAKELRGTPWTRYVAPESLEQMLKYHKLRRKDPGKAPKQYEVKLINKKGEVRHALLSVELMPGSKKSVVSMVDITPQKEAEAALRESEERYKRLSKVAHEGIGFAVNSIIQDVNQRLAEMTGYSREELIGSPLTKFIHTDDQPLVIENIRSGYAKPYECRLQRKDGSILYVEVHGETMEYKGQIARVAGIFDITEKRNLQQALLKTKERLHHLLTVSPAVVHTLNPETFEATWVSPNITEKLGYTVEEALRPHWWEEHLHPQDREKATKASVKILSRGHLVHEYRLRKKDGSYLWVRDELRLMRDAEGKPVEIVGAWMDITERRHAEEKLRISEERFRRTFALSPDAITITRLKDGKIVSINNGFTRIMGYTEDEIIGKTSLEIGIWLEPQDRQKLIDSLRKKGEISNFESRFRAKNGDIHVGLMSASVVELEGETHIIIVTRDITKRKEMEEKLRQSEANLRAYLESAPDAVYIHDLNGVFIYGNKEAEALSGYKRGELIGKSFLELQLLPPKELEKARQLLAQNARGEPTGPDEFELVCKDGRRVWVEINTTPVNQGKETVVIGFVRDITERKRMEMIQTAQYNIARAMISKSDLISLFKIIRKELSTFLDIRNFILTLYDEKRGMLHSPFARDEKDTIPPSWPAKTSLTGQVIKREKPLLLRREDIEKLARKGTIEIMGTIPEVWLGIPLFSEEQIVGVLVIQNYEDPGAYDKQTMEILEVISHGLRSYISLKQAEVAHERLTAAIEHAAESVIITDPQGKIEYVNPAFERLTGYSQSEVLGKSPGILKSGKQNLQFYKELWQTISSGKTWHGKFINRSKDGSLFTEEASISPVFDTDRNIIHYVAVKRDVTREEELEQQLIQAQKMEAIGQLAGGVAHDFNNMLNIILGYGDMILEQLCPEDPLAEQVKQIIEAGKRSAALTRQLLAFSRKQPLKPKVLDLNIVVRDLQKMLRRLIGEDIDLMLRLSDGLHTVMADPGQMEQVIMNLAVNARDAMPKGGKLIIETANVKLDEEYTRDHYGIKPGSYVMLAISDTGYGMDRETASKIFDPFFTTKEKGKGTGLGLATVYGIVKQSGGNIWVYSEQGRGTTFKVYLPKVEAEVAEEKKKVTAVVTAAGEHILVVEDEEILRKLAEKMLKRLGYRVTVAANGGEALLVMNKKGLKPNLLITDVVMPNMSGRELVETLRVKFPDLKVLYMSGYTDNAIVHNGVVDSDAPFIQKPFTIHELAEKIRQVLQGMES